MGLVAIAAAQRAEDYDSHQQVADQIRGDLPLTHGYFALDTLEYLQKGGRIGKAQAFIGSVLNVKPILTLRDGEAHPVERLRNRDRALRRLGEITHQLAPVAYTHLTLPTKRIGENAEVGGAGKKKQIRRRKIEPERST